MGNRHQSDSVASVAVGYFGSVRVAAIDIGFLRALNPY